MAAYRRVYDSRHLQADCQKTGMSSGTLHSVFEYGLPLPFFMCTSGFVGDVVFAALQIMTRNGRREKSAYSK